MRHAQCAADVGNFRARRLVRRVFLRHDLSALDARCGDHKWIGPIPCGARLDQIWVLREDGTRFTLNFRSQLAYETISLFDPLDQAVVLPTQFVDDLYGDYQRFAIGDWFQLSPQA